jgi:cell division GTPase FtsZ
MHFSQLKWVNTAVNMLHNRVDQEIHTQMGVSFDKFKGIHSVVYVVYLKISENGNRNQTKHKIQTN